MGTPQVPPTQEKKFQILLLNAMTRPLAAAVVAVTLVVALNVGYWFFLVGGLFYVVIVYFSLRDARESKKVLNEVLYPERTRNLDLGKLQGGYHTALQRALDTRSKIETAVAQTDDPTIRSALTQSIGDLEELTGTAYDIALKAQSLQAALQSSGVNEPALKREIAQLQSAVRSTSDDFTRSQYQAALDGKTQQLKNYQDTGDALQRWQAQLDNALSTLDTILSQVLRIRSSEVLSLSTATDQVSQSLKEQVGELKATSDALDEVYGLTNSQVSQ